MKILNLLSDGTDGYGVTTVALGLSLYLESLGHEVQTIAPSNGQAINTVSSLTSFDISEIYFDSTIDLSADILVIHCLPRNTVSEEFTEGFKRLIDNCQRCVLYFHNHTRMSLTKTSKWFSLFDRADVIFSLSDEGVIREAVDTVAPGKLVYDFQPGVNMDMRFFYWRDIEKQTNHHRYVGRCNSWKGTTDVIDYFARKEYDLMTLDGITNGITSYYTLKNQKHLFTKQRVLGKPMIRGAYDRSTLFKELGYSTFGYQLSSLPEKQVQRALECTHLEIVMCGVIPVFKDYGVRHRVSGKLLSEHSFEESGTIWFNEPDIDDKIKMLEDPALRDTYRNAAYEFYREHQHSEFVFAEQAYRILG